MPGVTLAEAPSAVAQGGLLAILGDGLAQAHTVAGATPLPRFLEDPAVEVLVNGAPVPLYFVSPGQINAQVPWDAELGSASVTVRRAGVEGTAMSVQIVPARPELFTAPGSLSLVIMERTAATPWARA